MGVTGVTEGSGRDRECFRFMFFFFFKQKTAYEILTCDWSSDVCSSDLVCLDSVRDFHIVAGAI